MDKNLLPIMRQKLLETEEYRYMLEYLKYSRPVVPKIDPAVDNDRAVLSNMLIQQGFDLAVSILNPERKK